MKNSLSKISELNAVHYQFRVEEFKNKAFSDDTQLGFIAQEVQTVYPEIVNEDKQGYLSISYISLIPALANAVKELKVLNDEMRVENDVLKTQLNNMQNEMVKIKDAANYLNNAKASKYKSKRFHIV